jgi:uncharacterized membrane protein YtjA (UPF0391 family)
VSQQVNLAVWHIFARTTYQVYASTVPPHNPTEWQLQRESQEEKHAPLRVSILLIAVVAAVLRFGGVAGAAASIAKILAIVFLVVFVVSLMMGRSRAV